MNERIVPEGFVDKKTRVDNTFVAYGNGAYFRRRHVVSGGFGRNAKIVPFQQHLIEHLKIVDGYLDVRAATMV